MRRESCDSLAAISLAAARDTRVSSNEAAKRNQIVEERLVANGQMSVDVISDGNCLFRSISVCLTGSESKHTKLRNDIVQHMVDNCADIAGSASRPATELRRHFESMRRDGVWAGEDVVKAAASCLGRAIHVYTASGNSWPLIYQPEGGAAVASSLPIKLAFYEPGHYRAVYSSAVTGHLNC